MGVVHPVTKYVEQLVVPLLGAEFLRVDEHLGEVGLGLEIVVESRRAKGVVIGEKGETITAIRHLARRLEKLTTPRVRTTIEVVDLGEIAR